MYNNVYLFEPSVMSSAKTCLMEEQTVPSYISCFHLFVILFMVGTAQGATKMFAVESHKRQISQALIRRRALRAASDQSLQYVSLHKVGFRRLRHILVGGFHGGEDCVGYFYTRSWHRLQLLCEDIQGPYQQRLFNV